MIIVILIVIFFCSKIEKYIFLMENIQFTARRWLEQPGLDDRGLGRQAIALVVEDGLKIATVLPGNCRTHKNRTLLSIMIRDFIVYSVLICNEFWK